MPRAWTYLQERFPLPAHAPLVFAFAGGVACASAALRGADGPGWPAVGVAATVALGFFFQLRVADEWKDADTDRRFRPDLPVPRGLVTIRELTIAAIGVAVVQLGLAAWLHPRLVLVVLGVWAFGALMTVEFGVRAWLRARPVATLLSHALIVPAIDFFAVSCDVYGNGADYPEGVGWLIGVSYFGGMVVEIGRKIRASEDEREGVVTYSALWGPRRALAVWIGVILLSLGCGALVVLHIDPAGALRPLLVLALALAGVVATVWGVTRTAPLLRGRAAHIETLAGVWTLALYLTIGPLALWLSR